MTILDYLDNTYRSESEAVLQFVHVNDANLSLVFDRTIFYPKGGGQPSDKGQIIFPNSIIYSISSVEFNSSTGEVLHVISVGGESSRTREDIEADLQGYIGSTCILNINMDQRLNNAKAHSAGHLIDAVVHEYAPEITGNIGCHDSGNKDGCYVKFQGLLSSHTPDELLNMVNDKIRDIILEKRRISSMIVDESSDDTASSFSAPAKKACRVVTIEGYPASPCGGTHVNSFEEYQRITVTRIKVDKREKMTKVNYTFE